MQKSLTRRRIEFRVKLGYLEEAFIAWNFFEHQVRHTKGCLVSRRRKVRELTISQLTILASRAIEFRNLISPLTFRLFSSNIPHNIIFREGLIQREEIALYSLLRTLCRMVARLPLLFTVSCLFLIAGCQKDEIKTYRVAKDQIPPTVKATPNSEMPPGHPPTPGAEIPPGHPPVAASQGSSMPSAMQSMTGAQSMANTEAPPSLLWTAPSQWHTKPLGQMRKGSYSIPGEANAEADLSIFVFPGSAGGLVDNINRWRSQIGLDPIPAARLADETAPLRSDSGLDFTVVDMGGKSGDRILGAILVQGDFSWFFKLKGADAIVAKNKADFLAFLKTVKQP